VTVDFFQVDVFADAPYSGNPLAVFPEPRDLTRAQMQAIAREMNLSETTFVTGVEDDSYAVRIFTPEEELPFAGHPTLGTAWVLMHLGRISGNEIEQRSSAGVTPVRREEDADRLWFERSGSVGPDLEDRDADFGRPIARALALEPGEIGLEARELGRSGRLRPAVADAGVEVVLVPVRDLNSLTRCRPNVAEITAIAPAGVYCFTAVQAGRVRARGFFPSVGITEDPGTGSAAAALGLYLADRFGDVRLELRQGVELGRPSIIDVNAAAGTVQVGGRCVLALTGSLEAIPPTG
jgi:trans-2,3-dihydro-3-hydroxyanthranilate isomerase